MDSERRGSTHHQLLALFATGASAVGFLLAWEHLRRPGLRAAEQLGLGGVAAGTALAFLSLVFALRSAEGPAARLGWVAGRLEPAAWCVGVLAIVALSHGVDACLHLLGWGSPSMDRIQSGLEGVSTGYFALAWIGIAVIAPLGEELFFRGLVQRGLCPGLGPPAALLVASLLFGLAHAEPTRGVGAFCLGLALGWAFDRSGSLWLPCLAHVFNNGIAVLELWVPIAPPVGAWETALCGLAVGLVGLAWMKRGLGPTPDRGL